MSDVQQQKQAIMAQMKRLEESVKQCAPHPDNPKHRGFIFAQSDSRLTNGDDNMFSTLVADQILGCGLGVFSEGIIGEADIGHIVDVYDQFWVDRRQSEESRARATLNSFNAARLGSKHAALEIAFEKDLPVRTQIERQYMQFSRQLDDLEMAFDSKFEMKLNPELLHALDNERPRHTA